MATVPTNLNSKVSVKLTTSSVNATTLKPEILNINDSLNYVPDTSVVNAVPIPTKFDFGKFISTFSIISNTVVSKIVRTTLDVINEDYNTNAQQSPIIQTSDEFVPFLEDTPIYIPANESSSSGSQEITNNDTTIPEEEPEILGSTNDLKLSIGGSYSEEQLIDENGFYAIPKGGTSAKAYESYQGVTRYANGAICQGTTYNGVTYDTRTEEETGLRYTVIDGEKYYCVATGGAYGKVGDLFEVTTDTGQTFKCIKGDEKSNGDSNSKNIIVDGKSVSVAHGFGDGNNCVIEMICDGKPYQKQVRNAGSYDALEQFSGNIESMRLIGSTQ